MSRIPVVEHHRPDPPPSMLRKVHRLANRLVDERPELAGDEMFRNYVPDQLDAAPTLHLDDLSEVRLLEAWRDVSFQQDRARLRAGDGDFLAVCLSPSPGYEEYCRERLGLGSVEWLYPRPRRNPLQVSAWCWQDERVRRRLVQALYRGELRYIHPHIGSRPVWELAALLSHYARRPLKVIAPPPAIAKWVNDKLVLTGLVRRLFGSEFVPRTEHAANFATAARLVSRLAESCRALTLKLPDSVGGGGNVVAEAKEFRGRSLHQVRDRLKELFAGLAWQGESELLIGCWETEVCGAPSAQLWIPPEPQGPPVVEGLCEQQFEDRRGMFVGVQPANLPGELTREIVNRCWLLARLFQRLGYVGRCSFDMLLVGPEMDRSRLEFLECNGRWGGASLPMTLMNRLAGDWKTRPHAVRDIHVDGLDRLSFQELAEALDGELYDARTGSGSLILFNPARLHARSSIGALLLGSSWQEAAERLRQVVPARLAQAVRERG